MRERAQVEIVSVEIFGRFRRRVRSLDLCRFGSNDADDAVGDPVLQFENVLERAVIFFSPEMRAGFRLEKLRGDTQAAPRLSHAAFQHIAHAEFASDPPHVDGLPL